MSSSEFDLTALTQAHDRLSGRIALIVSLRLLVLLALVLGLYIGFARALRRVDFADYDATSNEIQVLARNLGKEAPTKTPEEEKAVQNALQAKRRHLSEILDHAFVSKHGLVPERARTLPEEFQSLLWVQVTFDVRQWAIAVPPLLILLTLSQVHLHILRKERQLLGHVKRHFIEIATPADFPVERLLFARQRNNADPFARHPAQFVKWLNGFAWLGLSISLFPLLTFPSWGEMISDYYSRLAVALALYAIIYGHYVSARLERQTEAILGRPLAPTWVARCWKTGTRWAQSLMARLKPQWSLGTGSLLLLMTLFVATSTDGCQDYRGYEIILGRGRWWSAGDTWLAPILNPITLGFYILSLLLAVASLFLVLAAARRLGALRNLRELTILSAFSCAVSLFTLGDFSALVIPLAWLVPLGVWLRFGFSRTGVTRARWLRIRPTFVALLLPVVVLDIELLILAVYFAIYGLVAFYLGVHLLALGYLKLAKQAQEAAEAATGKVTLKALEAGSMGPAEQVDPASPATG